MFGREVFTFISLQISNPHPELEGESVYQIIAEDFFVAFHILLFPHVLFQMRLIQHKNAIFLK